jgi:hypothetical protein
MAKHTQRSFFVKYYSKAFSTLPGLAGGLAQELLDKARLDGGFGWWNSDLAI